MATPLSRAEAILQANLNGETYNGPILSRIEEQLAELNTGGGGGGEGTKDYNKLNNKPQLNGTTLQGNQSLEDLGIQEEMESISSDELSGMWED